MGPGAQAAVQFEIAAGAGSLYIRTLVLALQLVKKQSAAQLMVQGGAHGVVLGEGTCHPELI